MAPPVTLVAGMVAVAGTVPVPGPVPVTGISALVAVVFAGAGRLTRPAVTGALGLVAVSGLTEGRVIPGALLALVTRPPWALSLSTRSSADCRPGVLRRRVCTRFSADCRLGVSRRRGGPPLRVPTLMAVAVAVMTAVAGADAQLVPAPGTTAFQATGAGAGGHRALITRADAVVPAAIAAIDAPTLLSSLTRRLAQVRIITLALVGGLAATLLGGFARTLVGTRTRPLAQVRTLAPALVSGRLRSRALAPLGSLTRTPVGGFTLALVGVVAART